MSPQSTRHFSFLNNFLLPLCYVLWHIIVASTADARNLSRRNEQVQVQSNGLGNTPINSNDNDLSSVATLWNTTFVTKTYLCKDASSQLNRETIDSMQISNEPIILASAMVVEYYVFNEGHCSAMVDLAIASRVTHEYGGNPPFLRQFHRFMDSVYGILKEVVGRDHCKENTMEVETILLEKPVFLGREEFQALHPASNEKDKRSSTDDQESNLTQGYSIFKTLTWQPLVITSLRSHFDKAKQHDAELDNHANFPARIYQFGNQIAEVQKAQIETQRAQVELPPSAGNLNIAIPTTVPKPMVNLPLWERYQTAHVTIDNLMQYLLASSAPRTKVELEIRPRIQALQRASAAEYKGIFKEFFPSKSLEIELSDWRRRQAKERVRPLVEQAEVALNDLKEWAIGTGVEDLSREKLHETIHVKGEEIWVASFRNQQETINKVIANFTYNGQPLGYVGSMKTGFRGPHKGKTHFDPDDFDVDLYVVDEQEYERERCRNPKSTFIDNDKIFPSEEETPHLMIFSKKVVSALAEEFPGVKTIFESTVVLRRVPPW